jgi:hypothetical protein
VWGGSNNAQPRIEDEWEEWARETVEAEAYSHRLGKCIREGYAAKFRRFADLGGHAPLGFPRMAERPQALEEGYLRGALSRPPTPRPFGFGDVVQLRTFIVDHNIEKLNVLVQLIHERWGDRPPTQTLIGVAALALPDMLFEVDALAVGS